ncbi:MAG TPA: hypothetical protein VGS23_02590 [Thermoplasmata archaeon]|nr:hypothetical protein [Thermoplasmata archaeon]
MGAAPAIGPLPAQPPPPPPPAPPPPWQYAFPYPPIPPPRRNSTSETVIIVVVVVVALVGAPLFFVFEAILAGGGIGTCGGCAGSTPVGSAIALSNATLACRNSPSAAQQCTYHVSIMAASPPLPAVALALALETSNGNIRNGLVANASIVEPSGCTVSIWVFENSSPSLGAWGTPPASGRCANLSAGSPLEAGEQFVLVPAISSSPSLSGHGYSLVLIGVRDSYSGTVAVSIP